MTAEPLVSVITPTWRRPELLLKRCIPSVQAQTYPNVEHVVISDGPDDDMPDIDEQECHQLWYAELAAHDPGEHWGHLARLAGIEISSGEYIAYCDDDDSLRPEHCALLAAALDENPDAGFAVSRMMSRGPQGKYVVGWGPLALGNVGTPMIMHRRETLQYGTWRPAGLYEDWDLVSRWLDAGVRYASVDAETVDVWPSVYWPAPATGRKE